MTNEPRAGREARPELDLVRLLYSRRAIWGTDTMLYRSDHPMAWQAVQGAYQNWEIDTSDLVPADAGSPDGEAALLFSSEDVRISLSRRRESMRYFFRNCDAAELHLVSHGTVTYETDFGTIEL